MSIATLIAILHIKAIIVAILKKIAILKNCNTIGPIPDENNMTLSYLLYHSRDIFV